MIDSVYIAETVSKTLHSDISPETLLSKLRISLDYAQAQYDRLPEDTELM